MDEPLIVSILQLEASHSKEEAMERIERLARQATGDLIVIPEYSMFDPTGLRAEEAYQVSEPVDGGWVGFLRDVARGNDACVVGTLFERGPSGKPYNSLILLDRNGDTLYVYRKTHLFDALGYCESCVFEKGGRLPEPVKACGATLGFAICFEIRYPELFRLQALSGAEVFVVPSAWYKGPGKEEMYRFLAQARAHENVSYLVGAVLAGGRFTGRSLIVDPYGIVTADAGFDEGVVEAILLPERLEQARRKLPLLELRREDLYSLEGRKGKHAV